ncbi:alpha/beta hydrolase fold domain-containing protein [Kitasatospora sp. NPDC088134]|uniref:alpha/beta hydrolase fold domain-containing protein n=1 Tax=Kitasatospora sp. NPDC088134 TaxID=3364071 RepID=UPI00380BD618
MPLHPQAEAMRARRAAAGTPPLYTRTLAEARAADLADLRTATGAGEQVHSVREFTIDGPGGPLTLRHYLPKAAIDETAGPALLYLYGGGWALGSLETGDPICRSLANATGAAVLAVGYRHAPEHRFPAAVHDCWAALDWIARHATDLRLDPTRLAVGGDSAGGNLAAALTLLARDRGGPPILHQLLIYPNTDHRVGPETPAGRPGEREKAGSAGGRGDGEAPAGRAAELESSGSEAPAGRLGGSEQVGSAGGRGDGEAPAWRAGGSGEVGSAGGRGSGEAPAGRATELESNGPEAPAGRPGGPETAGSAGGRGSGEAPAGRATELGSGGACDVAGVSAGVVGGCAERSAGGSVWEVGEAPAGWVGGFAGGTEVREVAGVPAGVVGGDSEDPALFNRHSVAWYWSHYLAEPGDAANPLASPLRAADHRGLPAATVVTAEYDPLCAEGEEYAEVLRRAGVAVELRRYAGMPHGFFAMPALLDDGRAAQLFAAERLVAAYAAGREAGR